VTQAAPRRAEQIFMAMSLFWFSSPPPWHRSTSAAATSRGLA